MFEIIKKLEEVAPRKGKREKLGVKIIKQELDGFDIYEQKFKNEVPKGNSNLKADGKKIILSQVKHILLDMT